MSESLLSKIREETVQARTRMYDLLSLLRRRGVTSGLVTFGRGSCELMFWNGQETEYRYILEKYDDESATIYDTTEPFIRRILSINFVDTKHVYSFLFTENGIINKNITHVRGSKPFDISELLYELKFEGMK